MMSGCTHVSPLYWLTHLNYSIVSLTFGFWFQFLLFHMKGNINAILACFEIYKYVIFNLIDFIGLF